MTTSKSVEAKIKEVIESRGLQQKMNSEVCQIIILKQINIIGF